MPKNLRRTSAILAVAAAAGAAAVARANNETWNVTSGFWDTTSSNWSGPSSTYADGDDVIFSNASGTANVTVQAGGVAPSSINVSGGATYTFKGGTISSGYLNYTGTGSLSITNLNTYTGPTTVGSTGAMSITTLADGGLASSIGAATTLASNLVISGSNTTGTSGFDYAGSTNVSTNRLFTIGSVAMIHVSTGAQITFSSTGLIGFAGSSSATLVLNDKSSSTTGLLVLTPELDDNGSAKSGITMSTAGSTIWLAGTNNQYTGATTMSGGNFIVSKLADGGQASSIGKSGNAATNWLIAGLDSVKYMGSGDQSDRNYTITGTTNRAYTLDASGSGPLTLTGSASYSSGSNPATVTLTGSSLSGVVNQYNGVIANANTASNAPMTLSLTKAGSNTWQLSSSNTYNGDTTIAAGTLLVNGGLTTIGTSAFASSSTATLTVASGGLAGITYGAYVTGSGVSVGARVTNYGGNVITLSASGVVTSGTALTFITGSGTGTGNVMVSANATLGGSGTVYGATTLANNAVLSPGSTGAGELAFGQSLTLAGTNTKINMDVATGTRGTNYDAVDVGVGTGGVLTYGGDMTLTINSSINVGTYNLFAFDTKTISDDLNSITLAGSGPYAGTFTNLGSGVWTLSSANTDFEFDESSGDLIVTVPEPSITALGLGLLVPLLRRRRIARKAANDCV